MTENHPITPPAELVQQWRESKILLKDALVIAAQWGADQELEACCEWFEKGSRLGKRLRAARRPKPPGLKEQALLQLDTLNADLAMHGRGCDLSQIRRALEALPE